mmetsp:Transcript_7014/g.20366  ORF Transcript_7014/g.20366 Transcript_7014/m.20366 type:complete len:87 (+) Transcript_7014:1256-1516(+)
MTIHLKVFQRFNFKRCWSRRLSSNRGQKLGMNNILVRGLSTDLHDPLIYYINLGNQPKVNTRDVNNSCQIKSQNFTIDLHVDMRNA